jgi:hypothetical protein
MPQDYNPSLVPFDPKECGAPMIEAVKQLADVTGQNVASFHGRTLTEIFQLADDTYDELPEFWRVWKEWHAPQPRPEMGDL